MSQERALQRLRQHVMSAQQGASRVLVALAGPPGSGKTTLASDLVQAICDQSGPGSAALVPMDGFHLDNAELQAKGLFPVKGAAHTFDARAFLTLVETIRSDTGAVLYPLFDRTLDRTLPDAATLDPSARFAVFEGNYLLIQKGDWAPLRALFDVTVMLRVPEQVLRARLVKRWLDHGLPLPEAEARADGNDMVNARFVMEQSTMPDLVLVTQPDGRMALELPREKVRHHG